MFAAYARDLIAKLRHGFPRWNYATANKRREVTTHLKTLCSFSSEQETLIEKPLYSRFTSQVRMIFSSFADCVLWFYRTTISFYSHVISSHRLHAHHRPCKFRRACRS